MELDLDLLKKDWNKKHNNFKQYSKEELFRMTKRKSISIAKWVFVIAILEIIFWYALSVFLEYFGAEEEKSIIPFIEVIYDIIDMVFTVSPIVFISILIYLNYRIRIVEAPKRLMRKILLMKKTIRWYIQILVFQFVAAFLLGLVELSYGFVQKHPNATMLSIGGSIFLYGGFILLIRWIYRNLIYGKMLKRLKENYEELNKVEDQEG